MNRTSRENPLPISARHLTAGDHFFSWMVSSMQYLSDNSKEFTLITPGRSNGFALTVKEEKWDDVVFPVHKRGDDYSPTARNRAMGLPDDLDRPEPPKPAEPVARYEVGTKIKDLKHFDRSQHVLFACPFHHTSAWSSKDPYSSSIFPQSDATVDCSRPDTRGCHIHISEYVLTHVYLPTRNG